MSPDAPQHHTEDLVLRVMPAVDRAVWDESRYEPFIEELCRGREYQRQAILEALRYFLGNKYACLRDLARENFDASPTLQRHYGSWSSMLASLQFPEQLSASLDLATGTGKSYVLYAIAAVLLAEGAVESVLVLCPSLTIESGLTDKFRSLAERDDLRTLMPQDAVVAIPTVINANQTIVAGSICVENFHAVLERTGSSVRDSLRGKGERVAVLNDEAHHIANPAGQDARKWKEFLADPAFGFRMVLGVSGTCYVGDEYFSDVIFRYSLRQAIEEGVVKRVRYVEELPDVRSAEEKWQLIRQIHEDARTRTTRYGIRPLTILVTKDIARCKAVAEQLKQYLVDAGVLDAEQADRRVLTIYNNAPDVPKLRSLDDPANEVEWVVSVSMLNEGWDVQRVFAIVPHEERAFNSKLLIAQVLGRGLRVPAAIGRGEPQPFVTVFNHEAWAGRIRHLVNEVLEDAQRLTSSVVEDSKWHFALHTVDYERVAETVETPFPSEVSFLEKGYIDLPADTAVRTVDGVLIDAVDSRSTSFKMSLEQRTYEATDIAAEMHQRLGEIDEMNAEDGNPTVYQAKFMLEKLGEIVSASLSRVGATVATERMRQRILAAMGVLNRGVSKSVRWRLKEDRYRELSTAARQADSVSAQELRASKFVFYTDQTRPTLDDRQKPFFDEVTEEGSRYGQIPVANPDDFKVPLNLVIADSNNERRFILFLKRPEIADAVCGWLKSVPVRFYDIDYTWRKGEHQKQGKFSPDFFIRTSDDVVVVAEVKGDEEIADPSDENIKKNEYAKRHFGSVNDHLEALGSTIRYKFTFISPRDFESFFQYLQDGRVAAFRSDLDVTLDEALSSQQSRQGDNQ